MSDLATNLLMQYYGLDKDKDSSNKKFVTICQSVETAKVEEEKQVIEQVSSPTNEENASDGESVKDEDCLKLSSAYEPYPRSSRVLEDIEDVYNPGECSDIVDIDLGANIMCEVEDVQRSEINEECLNTVPLSCIKTTPQILGTEENCKNNANESELSLTPVEDTSADNSSDGSSMSLKKSQKSSKPSTPLPPTPKKQPVCNETFVDFSKSELKEFPNAILNRFSQIKMLYLADNSLIQLPPEIFNSLKYLEWLDLRNNQLSFFPESIESHPCIETLLLQGNKLEKLPLELCTLPKLKTLQVAQNPLIEPPQDIVTSGLAAIFEFLRAKWNDLHPDRQVELKQNKIEPKLSTILCYQPPQRNRKQIAIFKNNIHNKYMYERRKLYKPSNRYCNEQFSSFTKNAEYLFAKKSTFFCDSCLENVQNSDRRKDFNHSKSKVNVSVKNNEIDEISNKILRLLGFSPRSLYVRQNINTLKTYRKLTGKECRRTYDKCEPVSSKIKNNHSGLEKNMCNNNIKDKYIFDIITKDRKRFKLHPMRLNNSEWMISCLENYLGINK